jgi:hypothetical protein
MAFTTEQKCRIRRYLGYPDLWRYKDFMLEGAMQTAGEDPDASALVIADLAILLDIDNKIVSKGMSSAGIKAVDEIHFYEGGAVVNGIRNVGRSVAGRIGTTLGVPFYSDYFGSSGFMGDGFSGGGSGGNIIPLG